MTKSSRRKRQKTQIVKEPEISRNVEELINKPVREPFSGWPMILGWIAMFIFTFHACTHMVAAGDTWVAMACGRHFVNHGVDTIEPFSANSHKAGPTEEEIADWPDWAQWITNKVGIETVKKWHPTGWVNQNWLTHVIFYELVPKSSYADGISFTSNALVYWKFAIYIITMICVYYTSRIIGADRFVAVVFSCFALFIGRSFLDIRPAGFSNMLVAVFLLILALAMYKNFLYIWLIVPLTVFWCNVHGGYIYVFIIMIPFLFIQLLILLPKKWTFAVGSISLWLILYALSYKTQVGYESLIDDMVPYQFVSSIPAIYADKILYMIIVFSIGCIAITIIKNIKQEVFYSYLILGLVIVLFTLLIGKYNLDSPSNLSQQNRNEISSYIMHNVLTVFAGLFVLSVLIILTALKKERLVSGGPKIFYHATGADIAAFIASIVFNPFHLTNLTHTFVISVSKNAERWRDIHEWHPAFDWANPVGTAVPFLIMFIIIMVVLLVWSFSMIYLSVSNDQYPRRKKKDLDQNRFQWPTINVVMIIIAALTIYMAIRSRRFIPIAGIAGCPIIAMLLTQLIHASAAKYNAFMEHGMVVPAMPKYIENGLIAFGAIAVLYFGTWWGLRFKLVYLDPWPNDTKFNSVFMRMTASDAKPFYAMKFIKDNKLHGKMFNYWTEGGFVAWGQEPDPNTGKTPLQLFMDGRAQAAYNRKTFDEWSVILAGGELTMKILQAKRARDENLSLEDYGEIGDFMDEQLTKRDVWCMLMPATIFNDPDRTSSYYTFQSLELHPSWRLVFVNDRQKLLVNIKTEQGSKLYNGILTGETKYPDEYHENLNRAHKLLVYEQDQKGKILGLAFAKKALEENPTPAAMMEIIKNAYDNKELRPDIHTICKDYSESFEENKEAWKKQDGYRLKVEAARLSNYYLAQTASANKNDELKNTYDTQRNFCLSELRRIGMEKRW